MATAVHAPTYEFRESSSAPESKASGVSWGAVIAGAFVTAALSLILFALGTGMGLSAMSLWSSGSTNERTVTLGAVFWLILVEIIACAMGGYLAGRLRTKWVDVHTHEVYFRDTAHGFLVWAVSLVISAGFLATAIASTAGGVAAAANTSATTTTRALNPGEYYTDQLFRMLPGTPERNIEPIRDEANVILMNNIARGEMNAIDHNYLARVVVVTTGMSEQDADKRVTDVFNEDLAAASAARKAAAHSLYWAFVAFLIGAFVASHAATIGGRQRDRVLRAV